MSAARDAYDRLLTHWRQAAVLDSVTALLGWDEQTGMPSGGAAHRGEQCGLLARLGHERRTDPRLADWLDAADDLPETADPTSPEAVNLREIRRSYDRLTKLPCRLVEEIAVATSEAHLVWVAARRENRFAGFQPALERIIRLMREKGSALQPEGGTPYDGLLDEYEPGMTAGQVRALFDRLKGPLVNLVGKVRGSRRRPDAGVLHRRFEPADQERFGRRVAAALGFDFERGRLDVSAHPFCCTVGPGDCRLTTRFFPERFESGFFGILHETGHGLYEQGLEPAAWGTPMGEAVSLGVHESQSRLWENSVGRSEPFWKHWFPAARETHPALASVRLEDFLFAANRVEPSLIRVEADEVTYNLHILVRFELEEALLAGDLVPADLPDAWREGYRSALGVEPSGDADGCLQDVHWSAGLFGYFPTYTLGNLFGAQLFAAARRDLGSLDDRIEAGEFRPLLDWLRAKVHRHGQRHRSAELITIASGSPPDERHLLDDPNRITGWYD